MISNLAGCPALAGLRGRGEANPTNLIRVMPAEGDEMQIPDTATGEAAGDRRRCSSACAPAANVHCITNAVAQNFTANALLAIGGVPR